MNCVADLIDTAGLKIIVSSSKLVQIKHVIKRKDFVVSAVESFSRTTAAGRTVMATLQDNFFMLGFLNILKIYIPCRVRQRECIIMCDESHDTPGLSHVLTNRPISFIE